MATKFKVLRNVEATDKLPPQCDVIFGRAVEVVGVGGEIGRKELITALGEQDVDALDTKQPIDRLVSFYAPRLKDKGLIEIIRDEPKNPRPAVKKPRAKKVKAVEQPAAVV